MHEVFIVRLLCIRDNLLLSVGRCLSCKYSILWYKGKFHWKIFFKSDKRAGGGGVGRGPTVRKYSETRAYYLYQTTL